MYIVQSCENPQWLILIKNISLVNKTIHNHFSQLIEIFYFYTAISIIGYNLSIYNNLYNSICDVYDIIKSIKIDQFLRMF